MPSMREIDEHLRSAFVLHQSEFDCCNAFCFLQYVTAYLERTGKIPTEDADDLGLVLHEKVAFRGDNIDGNKEGDDKDNTD